MNIATLIKAVKFCLQSDVPFFAHGRPGDGKSQGVAQACYEASYLIQDTRVSQLDPCDVRGIPQIREGRTHWCLPAFWPSPHEVRPTLIFLDELSAAPRSLQPPLYQIILDRQCGEIKFPSCVRVGAAGNRAGDNAVAERLSTALANRMIHLYIESDTDSWLQWAARKGQTPATPTALPPNEAIGKPIHPEIRAFLAFRPNALAVYEQAVYNSGEYGFASPRSWEIASTLRWNKPDTSIEFDVYRGAIGKGTATELVSFLRVAAQIPNPKQCLANPDSAPVPTDPSTLYALAGALVHHCTEPLFGNFIKYISRFDRRELQVFAVKDALASNPKYQTTRAMVDWSVKNSWFIL